MNVMETGTQDETMLDEKRGQSRSRMPEFLGAYRIPAAVMKTLRILCGCGVKTRPP